MVLHYNEILYKWKVWQRNIDESLNSSGFNRQIVLSLFTSCFPIICMVKNHQSLHSSIFFSLKIIKYSYCHYNLISIVLHQKLLLPIYTPIRIRVRIDPPHPFVCHKRWLNGTVLWIRLEKQRPCDTAGVERYRSPSLLKSMSSMGLEFAALHQQRWGLHASEKILSGT
jgi:hypothetical protein